MGSFILKDIQPEPGLTQEAAEGLYYTGDIAQIPGGGGERWLVGVCKASFCPGHGSGLALLSGSCILLASPQGGQPSIGTFCSSERMHTLIQQAD